ncbi:hypothetical protein AVEN_252256-1 [Araneus ventricosus]|uniref:Uncharacterized protein n=1 Tax=Araneus ventricosus TaxID=182803 RepID=A0A4Y2WF93_ARAVE|nr:hypothetical protein AVEN_252256-1 [Araneus ventricosus]
MFEFYSGVEILFSLCSEVSNHKRTNYAYQSRHADNLNDPTATAASSWALWPSPNSPYYKPLMRRLLRKRYDPSSAGDNSTHTIIISHREARLCLY